jgi:uncharacterized protein (DUF342 family)
MEIEKILFTNLIAVVILLVKEIFSIFKNSTKDNTEALKQLNATCVKLEKEIEKLNLKFEYLSKDLSSIEFIKNEIIRLDQSINNSKKQKSKIQKQASEISL